jgi:hypothetical protein
MHCSDDRLLVLNLNIAGVKGRMERHAEVYNI